MTLLLTFLLLQQPLGTSPPVVIPDSPGAVRYPHNVRITTSAICPQGDVRIVAQLYPTRAGPRIRELQVGRRRLPRAQLALIDQAIGGALIDTVHIRECVNPPDRRIRVQIRVMRSPRVAETNIELVTFFIDRDRIVIVP